MKITRQISNEELVNFLNAVNEFLEIHPEELTIVEKDFYTDVTRETESLEEYCKFQNLTY